MYTHTYTPGPGNDCLLSNSYVQVLNPQPLSFSNSAERYLKHMDDLMNQAQPAYTSQPFDLVSAVFGNQAAKHRLTSNHLAELIQERAALASHHKGEIRSRLTELSGALSIARMLKLPDSDRRINNVERMIVDLEKQERDTELNLWKDTLELRTNLLEARTQYHATSRRMNFLAGGAYAG